MKTIQHLVVDVCFFSISFHFVCAVSLFFAKALIWCNYCGPHKCAIYTKAE